MVTFVLQDGSTFSATVSSPAAHQSTLNGVSHTIVATVTNNSIVLIIDAPADNPAQLNTLTIPNVTRDSDGDNIADHLDLDDDQDGILDSVEDANVSNVCDSDNDGLPDSRDIDSDGDGITDNIEAQRADAYIAPSNQDNNGNGVDDAYETVRASNTLTALVPINSDLTDKPDYVDTDANNDGQPDNIEAGLGAGGGADGDGDGLVDGFDTVNEAQMGSSLASIQNNVSSPASLPAWQAVTYDCGDLPDGFSTTQANNGPCHTLGSLYLGSAVDSEADGVPSTEANVDASDDGFVWIGSDSNNFEFEATVTGGNGELGVWVDWNNNGVFSAEEFTGTSVTSGVNTLQITSPSGVGILSSVRVRLFPVGGAPGGTLNWTDYAGVTGNGEVEDYFFSVPTASEVGLNQFRIGRNNGQLIITIAVAFLLLAGATVWIGRNRQVKSNG